MHKLKFIVLIILFPFAAISPQTEYTPGAVYYGRNNYIEYTAGNLPLIFSVPHGGNLSPSEIPDRTYGTVGVDSNLNELAKLLFDELHLRTGKYPHMILCNLKRIKLDANRDSVEAAQGNPFALQAWREYHDFIRAASKTVTASSNRGLYLDLHGHGHEIQRVEIGYMLSGAQLDIRDFELNQLGYAAKTSIKNLVSSFSGIYTFAEILRGEKSLGSLLQSYNVPAVPSSSILSPGGADYFSGGYSSDIHGSRLGGTIDGLLVEHNYKGIRDSNQNLNAYVKKFAQVLLLYLKYFYNFKLISDVCDIPAVPEQINLLQNYPNPFNPATVISFTIPKAGFVTLKVYDIMGREAATLVNEQKNAGRYEVIFDASKLASGVYLYRLSTQSTMAEKKMILIR